MRYYPIIDNRASCSFIKQSIYKYKSKINALEFASTPKEADTFLVWWGDGFMLKTMRTYYKENKPFVWYNCGTLGFLMNHLDSIEELPKHVDELHIVTSVLLHIQAVTTNNTIKEEICINDLTIGNTLMDYFSLHIKTPSWTQTIMGSGVVLATSIGATGYTLNLGAPILPLESSLLCLAGVGTHPFQYKFLQPETITITIQSRSPIHARCDGHGACLEDVRQITITPLTQVVRVWFVSKEDFQTKRILLAEQKLWGMH